jgi:hypothetical protein
MSPATFPLLRAVSALAAVATLAALCLAIIVVRARNASRQAAGDMRAIFQAEAPVLDQANNREQQRDALLRKDLMQIARSQRSATSAADIAKRLPAAFSPMPRPLSVSFASRASGVGVSEAPAIITVPPADLKPLFDRLQDCRACQEQLGAAQQDLSDERAKVAALTIERDAAVKAARGGGFWSRFRTDAKWFVIGGVTGALAASAAHR